MNAKQKNLMMLLVSAVAAGGLGYYAYSGVLEPEVKELERKEVEDRIFAVHAPGERGPDGGEPAAPVFTSLSVAVKVPASKTVMERVDGTWRVTSPVNALADARMVENLTSMLAHTHFKATVDENPTDEDLERYGLKEPSSILTATAYVPDAQGGGKDDPKRQRTLTLSLGFENTFDGSVYLRREGDPRVHLVQGSLRAALQKHTHEWRDKTVFALGEPSLRRIEVKTKQHAYTLERDAGEAWRLRQPMALQADAEQVAQLVSSLQNERALSFPNAEREAVVRKALEKPAVEARFEPTSGAPVRLRVAGVRVDRMNLAYALVERGSDILLAEVNKSALSVLDVDPRELKNKKALSFRLEDVQQILVHPEAGGERIRLGKMQESQRWEVVEPLPGKAKEFKVAALLGALSRLKAASFGEAHPKRWEKYGIGGTSRGVTLLDAQGQELARLWLGSEVKGNPQRLWARGALDEVLEVEKSALGDLPSSVEDVLDGVPSAASSP